MSRQSRFRWATVIVPLMIVLLAYLWSYNRSRWYTATGYGGIGTVRFIFLDYSWLPDNRAVKDCVSWLHSPLIVIDGRLHPGHEIMIGY